MKFLARIFLAAGVAILTVALSGPLTAAQDDPRLDTLFDRLHATDDSSEARRLEQLIWSIWLEANDQEHNALMQGGTFLMNSGNLPGAAAAFSRIIEARPEFAEGWNKRATVYYLMGRFDESIADCVKTLELEPRHFGALSGLGLIHSALDDPATALHWFREALKHNPHMRGVAERADELAREVEGEPV